MRSESLKNPLGAAIVGQIHRGLFWRLRSEAPGDKAAALKVLAKPSALVSLLRRRLPRHDRAQSQPADQSLRETIPDFATAQDALREWRAAIGRA